jgi:hypothetical protein
MCDCELAEREQLAAIPADRNRPQPVERARIVLAWADRRSAQQLAQNIGVRPTVWRWQQRFGESRVEGLLCDTLANRASKRALSACSGEPDSVTGQTGGPMKLVVRHSLLSPSA